MVLCQNGKDNWRASCGDIIEVVEREGSEE